ncbi:unnamed protein product [Camellia sinensis]
MHLKVRIVIMACTSMSITTTSPVPTVPNNTFKEHNGLCRILSWKNLCNRAKIMTRSYSDNHLHYNQIQASTTQQPELKNSHSMGMFNFKLSSSIFPSSLRSFLFDPDTSKEMNITDSSKEMNITETSKEEMNITETTTESDEDEEDVKKRANWVERLLELRSHWRERQQKDEVAGDADSHQDCDEDEGGCEADYGDEEEEGKPKIDCESFSRLLVEVPWSDAKLLAQLAFLCNMAYVIPEIKAKDLRRYYGLRLVTSSLEKKAEAEALKAKPDRETNGVPVTASAPTVSDQEKAGISDEKRVNRPTVAYEIAASAASYVHSYTKDLSSLGSETEQEGNDVASDGDEDHGQEEESSSPRVYKSEMAASLAASTMTAVVAAGETEKQEAARDLQSLHSSPCEWFVCDDPSTYTRNFIIQGSDSLASWQANLFFEPTKFEGTEALVHRGIYEAAKGMYEQFMPEIMEHLTNHGERAKLQFTGHSLGGSLSLLVNLMLLSRKVVKPNVLRPVVTFGSPFVFCGGQKFLNELGLDENRVHCVMMHRDIVPRAFACNYPNHVALLLKRLNGSFRSHPCLNKKKLLYSPMGKIFILQPDEKTSPPHPLLPPGSALYALENTQCSITNNALGAFLNSPHPLETLKNPTAYGSEGTILRDHDSGNYLKAVNAVIRQNTKMVVRKVRKQRSLLWPLLTSKSPHAWSHERDLEGNRLVTNEVMTGV